MSGVAKGKGCWFDKFQSKIEFAIRSDGALTLMIDFSLPTNCPQGTKDER